MFTDDVKYLCCPISGEPLEVSQIFETDTDGEILSGKLRSSKSGNKYTIANGIPRFVFDDQYNKTWDYKWTEIDKGKGLNYKMFDGSDPSYTWRNIFDANDHDGKAYLYAQGKVVLDLGCGVGQYTWRMLEKYHPAKVVAMDLTGGVDIFRKIMLERFPEYKSKILMVQASVFQMPFRDETFDYVFSVGVLMHTGNTREAIKQATRMLKYGGQMNLWIYASEPVPYEASEPGRDTLTFYRYFRRLMAYSSIWLRIHTFRKMPHHIVVSIIRLFSSDFWYRLNKIPVLGDFAILLFGTVQHPDFDVRFINNYDGLVNTWSDTWNEHEIFPVLRASDIAIQGISDHRLGIWGVKTKDFYL